MDDIEKIIGDEKETQAPPSGPTGPQEPVKPEVDELVKKKEEHLANINKAITEGNEELRKLRELKKQQKPSQPPAGTEQLPEIDFNDPAAKAWGKHIRDELSPVQAELEGEKREIRTFALQQFLADKPSLAKSPEKVKELVGVYDRLRTATERTVEGVLLDLNRAYAAINADELLAAARGQRMEKAAADSALADIAVSRGASSYQSPKKPKEVLSEDDKRQLSKWGMTEDEWQAEKDKYQ